MSGWRSYLPAGAAPAHVVGLGLNAEEVADNRQLDEFVVHDLNREPRLPFGDAVFDTAVCAASVQYLVRPIEVFRHVRPVLRPSAPFVVAFTGSCFPEKAVAIWLALNDTQRLALVGNYFSRSGGWDPVHEVQRGSLCIAWARRDVTLHDN